MKAFGYAALLSFAVASMGRAQGKPEHLYFADGSETQRPFALVSGTSVMTINGAWGSAEALTRYAQGHAGHYIAFLQDGTLRRLDDPAKVAEAERMYAPMQALAAKQEALAAQQRPLAAQQQALGVQQRAATDPETMQRIGVQQGALGTQQGALGAKQGEIGRQQGELGRAFYKRVQTMLDACVADHSCRAVEEVSTR